MFGIGFFELVVIAVVALVFVGPQRLPEVMKQAGKFFVQFRRAANEVKSTFDGVIRQAEDELRREEVEAMRALLAKNALETTAKAVTPPAVAAAHSLDSVDSALKSAPVAANVPAGAHVYTPPHAHDHASTPSWETPSAPRDHEPAPPSDSTGIKDNS